MSAKQIDENEPLGEQEIKWRDEYSFQRPRFEAFTRAVERLLTTLLETEGIDYFSVDSRTKTITSFAEKISRDEKSYENPLADMTDLSGCRVICYYPDDIERIDKVIQNEFKIDRRNSVKKDQVKNPKEFGYRSRHLIVKPSPARARLVEWRPYKDMKCEIQVRTALQHAWAAIEHKLQYKQRDDVPQPVQRKFYQMAAILEVADDQFLSIRDALVELRRDYEVGISKGEDAIPLDSESLDVFLTASKDLEALTAKLLASRVQVTYPPKEDPGLLGKLLRTLPLAHIADLRSLETLIQSKNPDEWTRLLDPIWTAWRTSLSGRNQKLASVSTRKLRLNITSLVRLLLILSVGKPVRKRITSSLPFGSNLQRAILERLL